jgi:hypothetical protein
VRVDTLDGHAHLAAVDEGGKEQLRGDHLRIDNLEHDGRVVAAELERDALERRCRARHDTLATRDRARERDFVTA